MVKKGQDKLTHDKINMDQFHFRLCFSGITIATFNTKNHFPEFISCAQANSWLNPYIKMIMVS
jgi:hypothetical protein